MNNTREEASLTISVGDAKVQMAPVSPKARDGGPKACTGCHTTRTPQWREGPSGPKTLCNACGVRRVRRNKGRGPHNESTVVASHAPSLSEPWSCATSAGDEQPCEPPSRQDDAAKAIEPSPLGRRPQRKAAVKAASRTSESATAGNWYQGQSGPLLSPDGRVLHSAPPSPAATSSDNSLGGSDSAEEVAWAPAADVVTDVKADKRQDMSAAIDLLILNYKDTNCGMSPTDSAVLQQSSATSPVLRVHPSTTSRTTSAASFAHTGNVAASSSRPLARFTFLRANSVLSPTELEAEHLLRKCPDRFAQYEEMQSLAEASWRQSAASEAAIVAVAEFLAQKQAAAIKARHTARSITQELHAFLRQASTDRVLLAMPLTKRTRFA